VPTGVPIRDVRDQLFDAARSVLLRNGPDALTSRAVTTEAGLAKGILHRHFVDFDTFLASLVLAHIEILEARSNDLRRSAGSGTVVDNLAQALDAALDPSALAIISLVTSRYELLARLRLTTPTGIPVLAETTKMVATYLTAERGLGRIPIKADVDTLALILVGTAHLLLAGRHGTPAQADQLAKIANTIIADSEAEANRVSLKR
jgi:AcrR family transcriptional regulator